MARKRTTAEQGRNLIVPETVPRGLPYPEWGAGLGCVVDNVGCMTASGISIQSTGGVEAVLSSTSPIDEL
jgi:hypothetical protein